MKTYNALSLLLLIQFLFLSCDNSSDQIESKSKVLSDRREKEFTTQMESLFSKYPQIYDKNYKPNDTSTISQTYPLTERHYYPYFKNLTFDFRTRIMAGSFIYTFMHIYNDSLSAVLPLSDEITYSRISFKGSDTNAVGLLNFNTELNNVADKLGLITIDAKRELVSDIMASFRWERLDYADICKLKELAISFSKNSNYTDVCKKQLISSLKIVESQINNQNLDIFSNGLLIYIFSYSQGKESVKMEVLNSNCSYSYP